MRNALSKSMMSRMLCLHNVKYKKKFEYHLVRHGREVQVSTKTDSFCQYLYSTKALFVSRWIYDDIHPVSFYRLSRACTSDSSMASASLA